MERIKDIMSRYASFAWWVLMTLLSVFGIICGALQGGFFGVSGIIGCTLSAIIFGWQAWGEWLEAKEG
jgi:hypothetical protein